MRLDLRFSLLPILSLCLLFFPPSEKCSNHFRVDRITYDITGPSGPAAPEGKDIDPSYYLLLSFLLISKVFLFCSPHLRMITVPCICAFFIWGWGIHLFLACSVYDWRWRGPSVRAVGTHARNNSRLHDTEMCWKVCLSLVAGVHHHLLDACFYVHARPSCTRTS